MPIAPPSTPLPTGASPATLRRLSGLTALVLGAHWLLLQGVPKSLAIFQMNVDAAPMTFTTRTIEAPPPVPKAPDKPEPAKPRASSSDAPPPTVKPTAQVPAPATAEPVLQDAVAVVPGAEESGISEGAAPSPATAAPDTAAPASVTDEITPEDAVAAPVPATARAQPEYRFAFPEPVRLLYDVQGVVTFAYTGGAEMVWRHDGSSYTASLQITKFGFNLRNWSSKGTLSSQGIAPARFGDKGRSSEVAAHFQRDKGIVSFSNNAPDVPLQAGAQDHLSAFFQLSGMLAAEPGRFGPGTLVRFQAANAQGSQDWVFAVGETEALDLPGGTQSAIRLSREHSAQYDTKVEVWLAPALSYLPVRIRLSQTNGDFAQLLWRSTRKPD